MKRLVFFAIAILSTYVLAKEEALREFPTGSYLGEGWYRTSFGAEGDYSSFAEFDGDQWTAAYLRDGKLTTYTAVFDFTDDSFFNVDVTQVDSSGTETNHQGNGYCIGNTCHLSTFLSRGMLEETFEFESTGGRIKRIGSLMYIDENFDIQTIIWEEKMVLFSGNFRNRDGGLDDY